MPVIIGISYMKYLFFLNQHGIASKQAQVPIKNISIYVMVIAMLVGCGYKVELNSEAINRFSRERVYRQNTSVAHETEGLFEIL